MKTKSKNYAAQIVLLAIPAVSLVFGLQLFKVEALRMANVDHNIDEIVGKKTASASPSLPTLIDDIG